MYEPYSLLSPYLYGSYNQTFCEYGLQSISPLTVMVGLIQSQNLQTMQLNMAQAQLTDKLQSQMIMNQMINAMPTFRKIPIYNGEVYCLGYHHESDPKSQHTDEWEKLSFIDKLGRVIFLDNPIRNWREKRIKEIEDEYNNIVGKLQHVLI